MSRAEERIKPYLPRALRSAVSFDDGRITSDWDDRTAIRYEDDGSTIITTTQGTVCLPGRSTNRRGDGSVQATVDTARWSGSVRLEPGGVLPRYVIWDLNNPTE